MDFVFAPLFSGSSGNSEYVRCGTTEILIDAGLACKRISEELEKASADINNIQAVFVTHEHTDHIQGIGVLCRKYHIPVYATEFTWNAMLSKGVLRKIPEECVKYSFPGESIVLGDLCVKPFRIPHDAADPVGYSIFGAGMKLSIATDIGCIRDDWIDEVRGSDLLMLEANHDPDVLMVCSYPYELKKRILSTKGHLSNDDAGIAAVRLAGSGVKQIILAHLSKESNYPKLAWETVAMHLREAGYDTPLAVASRTGYTVTYNVHGVFDE